MARDGYATAVARRLSPLFERFPWLRRAVAPLQRHRWLRWTLAAVGASALLLLAGFVALWVAVDLPDQPPKPQAALVLAAGGEELAAFAPEGLRFEVPLEDIAPVAVQAVLAAEDRRFYDHTGLDPIGIVRAAWKSVRGGRQGGSTITQQLVKVDYLNRERTLSRKVKEAVLAMKLERSEDKDEILERYLNTVYFGRNAYGIEAAARAYFEVSAADLGPAQAALLAGLIRAPEAADPGEDPAAAARRRALVLRAMASEGVISPADAERLAASPLGAVEERRVEIESKAAPHFVDFVRSEAERVVGRTAMTRSGLRIVTTIDLRQQEAAEQAVREALTAPTDPQAALIALDADGAIRAYVGGRDHDALKVDLVRGVGGGGSGRQPGSTFKPFVLAAALERDITLGRRYPAPAHLDLVVDGQPWGVDNYGSAAYGTIDLLRATADSVNTVYAQLLQQVGPAAVAETAKTYGITSDLQPVPSIALGVTEVSPLELAAAYSTLANDGRRVQPYGIARIENADGDTVWTPAERKPEQVVRPEIARAVTRALQGVLSDGTGRAARIGRPAAGKTGTTQNNVDAWFAGYVPGFTTVVWLGNPEGATSIVAADGRAVTGGGIPARIWRRFMQTAVEGRDPERFPAPPEDLLAGPPPPTLAVEPGTAGPGQQVRVGGEGFETCRAGWWVQLDGTFVASSREEGIDAKSRQAALVLPPDLPPGRHRITAFCDEGTGARPVAAAGFTVRGEPEPSTTTTSSSTSSTSSTTSTTQPRSETTTTTAPAGSEPTTTTRPRSRG